jgi:hypothetical protein
MIDDARLAEAIKKMRKLRLVDSIPIKDAGPPAKPFLAVMKQGLGGVYDDAALEYIFRRFLVYYDGAGKTIQPGAEAEPATSQAVHGGEAVGRTGGSIPPTGATTTLTSKEG